MLYMDITGFGDNVVYKFTYITLHYETGSVGPCHVNLHMWGFAASRNYDYGVSQIIDHTVVSVC